MSNFALVFTAISTAVSVVGALRQGSAESDTAKYNAQVAMRNAEISRQQAKAEAAQIERTNRLRIGTIIANVGGSGITMEGSALEVLGDVVSQGELDRQQALYRGEIRAIGYEDTSYLERQRSKDARTAGYFRAGSALFKGAAQGYDQYEDIYGGTEGEPVKLTRAG